MGHALQYAKHLKKTVCEAIVLDNEQPKTADAAATHYIYSHLLGMKMYPHRDPITGRISKVVTEHGDTFTEEDLTAFRAVRDAFGIAEMFKVVRAKIDGPENVPQPNTAPENRKIPA